MQIPYKDCTTISIRLKTVERLDKFREPHHEYADEIIEDLILIAEELREAMNRKGIKDMSLLDFVRVSFRDIAVAVAMQEPVVIAKEKETEKGKVTGKPIDFSSRLPV